MLRRGLSNVSLDEMQYKPQEKSRMEKIWSLNLEETKGKKKKNVSLINAVLSHGNGKRSEISINLELP